MHSDSMQHIKVKENKHKMASKTHSHGSPNVCPICCKAIIDATKTREGQEALKCKGTCQKWIHRWCTGVHKQDYPTLSNSSDSWTCPLCCLKEYGQLIKSLMNTAEAIKAEVSSLKKQVNSKSCPPHEDPKPSPPQEDHNCPPSMQLQELLLPSHLF